MIDAISSCRARSFRSTLSLALGATRSLDTKGARFRCSDHGGFVDLKGISRRRGISRPQHLRLLPIACSVSPALRGFCGAPRFPHPVRASTRGYAARDRYSGVRDALSIRRLFASVPSPQPFRSVDPYNASRSFTLWGGRIAICAMAQIWRAPMMVFLCWRLDIPRRQLLWPIPPFARRRDSVCGELGSSSWHEDVRFAVRSGPRSPDGDSKWCVQPFQGGRRTRNAPCFTRGYGWRSGQQRRKTMSMALVDRSSRARELMV